MPDIIPITMRAVSPKGCFSFVIILIILVINIVSGVRVPVNGEFKNLSSVAFFIKLVTFLFFFGYY